MTPSSNVLLSLSMVIVSFTIPVALAEANHPQSFLGVLPGRKGDLLLELGRVMTSKHLQATERRISLLEATLRPKFAAMPKNGANKIGHTAVRYLLHRVFVDRHGWYVVGLDPQGESWNSSLPTIILQDSVPGDLHGAFEERLVDHGFSLHEVAVFAATLETLVHDEAVQRVRAVYDVLNQPTDKYITQDEMQEVVDSYMMVSVLGGNYHSLTPELMTAARENILELYPTFPETQEFVREVQKSVLSTAKAAFIGSQPVYPFTVTERVIEAIGEQYGRWQNIECQGLKHQLMEMEEGGSGRVPLDRFYRGALNGMWQFSEHVDHLRQSGTLDDSIPSIPRVIIPNYVYAPSNCVAGSSFYSTCCMDECEALLGHLEDELAAPEAALGRIIGLVSELGSSTVPVPVPISAKLYSRLQEIADQHGGKIPIHGRLFAQWLHHVYPRECPYPHLSGTTRPMSQEEWMEETGRVALATDEELKDNVDHLEKLAAQARADNVQIPEELLWNEEEELFVVRPRQEPVTWSWRSRCRNVFFLLALFAVIVQLVGTTKKTFVAAAHDVTEKMYV